MADSTALLVMLIFIVVFGWLGWRSQCHWQLGGSVWLLAPTLLCYTLAAMATFWGFLALLAMMDHAGYRLI